MSTSQTESSLAICPYWRGIRGKQTVRCEGFAEAAEVAVTMSHSKDLYKFCRRYCYSRYKDCPIAAAVEAKYD